LLRRESFEKRLDALDPVLLVALMQGGGPDAVRQYLDQVAAMELKRQKLALRERHTDLAIRVARNVFTMALVATALPFSPWALASTVIPAALYARRRTSI
jgi:hypothetical protein